MYTAQGKLNRDAVIQQYYPTVRRQALSLQVRLPAGVDLDDLIQAGLEGLLDALTRFDAGAGVAFSTFAHQRIRGSMIDELRSRDWLPRSVRRSGREVEACVRRLEQQLGRPPEEREIANALGMDMEEYHKLLHDTNNGLVLSYDEVVTDQSGDSEDRSMGSSPADLLFSDERRSHITEAIEALPEKEKLVMALYYQEELNLKEIGAVLGVTESRVSQLHSQAIKRIRSRVVDD
ncbi:RNA polymerase sigma factor FliA [Aliidiomarina halalkaliphila]|uniref:RNA polymerase sigma factor FliA n=1 Tax=Aliidiomarina halalkaliphila TaxID=2593535 RepID=A0A552X2J9_9GAMM|nr:RNA polymerase sigma factor FliA [Aliidiomarina halalkaliphila]TRW48843.1 RNA polymerase sigma factor FliA [Aliidiomarina halalkaliphila]